MANELFSIQMLQDVYHSEVPTVSIHVCTQWHTLRGRYIPEVPWVHITCMLSWSKQALEVKRKPREYWLISEELGILQISRERASIHGFGKADNSLVAHMQKDIQRVGSLQSHAAHFVHKDCSHHSSINSTLQSLGWPNLESRRRTNDLTMFYKILSHQVNHDFTSDLEGNSN